MATSSISLSGSDLTFPFIFKDGRLINTQTKREYKIQVLQGESVNDDTVLLARSFLQLLQVLSQKYSLSSLEGMRISKQGVKIPGFSGLLSEGSQLTGETLDDAERLLIQHFNHDLDELQTDANLKSNPSREIIFEERNDPEYSLSQLSQFEQMEKEIEKCIGLMGQQERRLLGEQTKLRLISWGSPLYIFPQIGKHLDWISWKSRSLQEIEKQHAHLKQLTEQLKFVRATSIYGKNEQKRLILEVRHHHLIMLVQILDYFEKLPHSASSLGTPFRGLFVRLVEKLSPHVGEDLVLNNPILQNLLLKHLNAQGLIEIEKRRIQIAYLQTEISNEKTPSRLARVQHELLMTQLSLYSEEAKLLKSLKQAYVDSLPRDRAFTPEEEKTLAEIGKVSSALALLSHETNRMRKEVKKEIPATDLFWLKYSCCGPGTLGGIILNTEVEDLLPSKEAVDAKPTVSVTSKAREILHTVLHAIPLLRKKLGNTLASLKSEKYKLRDEIEAKRKEMGEIRRNASLVESEKLSKVKKLEEEVAENQNKISLLNLQRQAALLKKLIEGVGFWQNFSKKANELLLEKRRDIEVETVKYKLSEYLLVKMAAKVLPVEDELQRLGGEDKKVVEDFLAGLPVKEKERKESLENSKISSEANGKRLQYETSLIRAEISEAQRRIEELNKRYESVSFKYDLNWKAVPRLLVPAILEWGKKAFKEAFSFGLLSTIDPPHPSRLQIDKQYADIGYNYQEEIAKWVKEASQSTDQPNIYFANLANEFAQWAFSHPTIASQLAGDLVQSISILRNKSIDEAFLSTLKGKVFTYAFLYHIKGVKDTPKIETEKSLRFRALADVARNVPQFATTLRGVLNIGVETASGAVVAGMPGALLSFLRNYTTAALDNLTTKSVQEATDKMAGPNGEFLLQLSRLIHNVFLSGVYIDSVVEQESLLIAKTSGDAYFYLNHLQGIGPMIRSKVSFWWSTVKMSKKWSEKILRLIPVWAGTGLTVLSLSAGLIGAPFSWGIVGAFAALLIPYFWAWHPQLIKIMNNFMYPFTLPLLKMQEIELFLKGRQKQVEDIARKYLDALLRGNALRSATLLPVPHSSSKTFTSWKAEEQNKKGLEAIQSSYKQNLEETIKQRKTDSAFQRRLAALKREKSKDWGNLTDEEWQTRQKIMDFQKSQFSGLPQFRTPILREVVLLFHQVVNIQKLEEEIKDAFVESLKSQIPGEEDIQKIFLENCLREILGYLYREWLEKELQTATIEQFKAFYVTYPDAFAKTNYEALFDEQFIKVQKDKVNSQPVEEELRRRLANDYSDGEIAGFIGQFHHMVDELRKRHNPAGKTLPGIVHPYISEATSSAVDRSVLGL